MNRRRLLAAAAGAALCPGLAWADPRFAAVEAYSDANGGAALVVQRTGVVLESYYSFGGRPDALQPLGRATRLFAPVLAATMVRDRLLRLDEPVAASIGAFGLDPDKRRITMRMLLAGSSGLPEATDPALPLDALAALPLAGAPGERFSNDGVALRVFGEIARRKLIASGRAMDFDAYLYERVLSPIGCVAFNFAHDESGAARLDDGAAVSAPALATLGEVIQRNGLFRGAYVLDANTLRGAFTGSFVEGRYGFGFWLASAGPAQAYDAAASDLWTLGRAAPIDLAMAAGQDGQRLYLIPSQRTVIVRLTTGAPAPGWSDAHFLGLLLGQGT